MSRPAKTADDHAMIKNDVYVSITINTNDTCQYFRFSTHRRLRYAVRIYYNICRLLTNVAKFELYPELSEKGRLHYHGTIKFDNVFEYYCHILPILSEISNVKLKPIDDIDGWKLYMLKDRGIMESGLTNHALPYELRHDNLKYKPWNKETIVLKQRISKEIEFQEQDYRRSIYDWLEEREED